MTMRQKWLPERNPGLGHVATEQPDKAMADPKHEEHDRMLEWHGGKFDPDEAEIGRILDNFERLAKKWAPKPRKPKDAPKRL